MRGLELAKAFWEEFGKPLLAERFPELMSLIAAGLVGSGSECYGYDDAVSRDHDFEPGFCLFLPSEELLDRRTAFLLERAYETLPKEFKGLSRQRLRPAGGNRHGVLRTADFYGEKTGFPGEPLTLRAWLSVPEYALAEAVNGAVFYDGLGEFSAIRNAWKNPPADIQCKKLAGYLMSMSQTGEYNYARSRARGESGAARLTAGEFVKAAIGAALWSDNRPVPYYKWSFRALCDTEDTRSLYPLLTSVLEEENAQSSVDDACRAVLLLLRNKGLLPEGEGDLQKAAFRLNEQIRNTALRNESILSAVGR